MHDALDESVIPCQRTVRFPYERDVPYPVYGLDRQGLWDVGLHC